MARVHMDGVPGRRTVLVFAAILPPLTLLGFVTMVDKFPDEWPLAMFAFAYFIGICPAVFTGLAWRGMFERGWRRPFRLAVAALAHPFAALVFFLPSFLFVGSFGFRLWLACVPLFAGSALAGGLVAELLWLRAARRSLAETPGFPT